MLVPQRLALLSTSLVRAMTGRTGPELLRSWKDGLSAWFWVALGLAAGFIFCCDITLVTFSSVPLDEELKKWGVEAGLSLGLIYVAIQLARGSFTVPVAARRLWTCFIPIAALLFFLLLGRPHLISHGLLYARMSSGFWSVDFTGEYAILLKRVGMPALASLLGFNAGSYVYFWLLIYLVALWLAVRWLLVLRFDFLECLSLLTSSIFAYSLIGPGYSEVLIFAGALVCLQRPTRLLDKLVIFALALGTHEVAACFVFLSILPGLGARDREEWLLVFLCLVPVDVGIGHFVQHLQHGARPGETLVVGGHSMIFWLARRWYMLLIGLAAAYKLYWLPLVQAWRLPEGRQLLAWSVLLPLILVLLATDTSRLMQMGSLAVFWALARVLSNWSPFSRRNLAVANLFLPSVYAALNSRIMWGQGFYSIYLKLIPHLPPFAGKLNMLWE